MMARCDPSAGAGRPQAESAAPARLRNSDETELIRTRERQSDPEDGPAGDFYVMGGPCSIFWITAETAGRVSRMLESIWPRRWVRFTDRSGSRAWVRAGLVEYIEECTELQRERSRAFHRALRRERKAERRWDEDE